MTRAEARRKKKEEKNKQKSRMMTVAAIDALKQEVAEDTTGKAFSILLGLSTYALRAEFDFNAEQLERFIDRVMSAYQAFEAGKFSIKDLHAIVYQETGITIHDTKGNEILPAAKSTNPKNHRENDDLVEFMTKLIDETEEANKLINDSIITKEDFKIKEDTNEKTMEKN